MATGIKTSLHFCSDYRRDGQINYVCLQKVLIPILMLRRHFVTYT